MVAAFSWMSHCAVGDFSMEEDGFISVGENRVQRRIGGLILMMSSEGDGGRASSFNSFGESLAHRERRGNMC